MSKVKTPEEILSEKIGIYRGQATITGFLVAVWAMTDMLVYRAAVICGTFCAIFFLISTTIALRHYADCKTLAAHRWRKSTPLFWIITLLVWAVLLFVSISPLAPVWAKALLLGLGTTVTMRIHLDQHITKEIPASADNKVRGA